MRPFIHLLKHGSTLLIIGGLIALVLGYFNKGTLPSPTEIDPRLYQDPVQEMIEKDVFDFDYRGSAYTVEQIAEYDLWGLVVTHNDIEAFDDIYHDDNSVDIKDLCVIWGENLKDGTYLKDIKFWSEPWTCYFQTENREAMQAFHGDQLSNSHLLSTYEDSRDLIRSVRIGDQINIRGYLVNYYPKGQKYRSRSSSTVRTDTGNGACEVVLVDSIEIYKKEPRAGTLYNGGKLALILAILIKAALFLFAPYRHYMG